MPDTRKKKTQKRNRLQRLMDSFNPNRPLVGARTQSTTILDTTSRRMKQRQKRKR